GHGTAETYDDGYDGHGTHVASYAAGRLHGVAKNAHIYSLRATGPPGDGTNCRDGTAVINAVNWITAHGVGPGVVNLSFCCGDDALHQAILTSIQQKGFLYTLSAGTGGSVKDHWGDGLATHALVVAGTDQEDKPLATTYGPLLSLFAPAKG